MALTRESFRRSDDPYKAVKDLDDKRAHCVSTAKNMQKEKALDIATKSPHI